MNCSTPGLPVPHHLLKFACVHVHCVSNAIQPSYPLMPSLLLPSIFFSISDFSNESVVDIRWPNYWSISINPSKEFSGLISLHGIDRFDLLAVQGAFWNPLQHHSSKASILWHSCLLYGPALTTIHDQWEDHNLEYMDLDYPDLIYFNDTQRAENKENNPLKNNSKP